MKNVSKNHISFLQIPKNMTTRLQPNDQCINHVIKAKYRRYIERYYLQKKPEKEGEKVKRMGRSDAVK